MSPRFLAFIPFIFKWEGGYDNDPDDPGGETKYGIDHRSHPNVDIKNLTKDGAQQIYWESYWVKYGCEDLPPKLGEVVFNACVNCGAGRAQKLVDQSGPDASAFVAAQDSFYHRLAAAKPALRKFLRGWLNRTRDLRKYLQL
jgi:lysozyme family protein